MSRLQQNRAMTCAFHQPRCESKSVLLHKTPRPGNHSQGDFILLQLEHGDERRVVHSHCCGSVHCHYLITAPGQNHRPLLQSLVSADNDDRS